MSRICQAPPQELRPLRHKLPPGSTDTHCHVFGPADAYPYVPARAFTPPDALPATAGRLLAEAGIERAVLVQASVYGKDNRRHLEASAEMRLPTRVVVVTDDDCPDHELGALHQQGARAMRFILANQAGLPAELARLSARLAERGWHLQILAGPDQLVELREGIVGLACPVVIDHLGLIDPRGGLGQPAFQSLLRLLDGGNCLVKLSGYYRLSRQGAPYDDMADLVGALLRAAPERMLWGSDWPHPLFDGPMPNLADLIDPLFDWIPDEGLRRRILVETPARLFDFDAAMDRHPGREAKAPSSPDPCRPSQSRSER